jgi:hypothetical protein
MLPDRSREWIPCDKHRDDDREGKERLYLFDTTLRARVARKREALSTRKQKRTVAGTPHA